MIGLELVSRLGSHARHSGQVVLYSLQARTNVYKGWKQGWKLSNGSLLPILRGHHGPARVVVFRIWGRPN